jgi:AraC family transcriptional regulator
LDHARRSPGTFHGAKDGALPATIGAGSAPGESGVSVLSARFKGAIHVSATSRRRHHVFFSLSRQLRYQCRLAGRSLSHEPPPGSLAVCPAESDYGADADGSAEAIVVSVDPGRLALAAAEDSEIEAQLIDRFSGDDQALLDFARTLASESAAGFPNGPLFWNEIASAFIDGLLARHTVRFNGRTKGILGKEVFRQLRDYILANLHEPIEVAALAGIAGRSEFHFTRVFTRSVGMSPHRYVVHLRLERAIELMRDGQSGLAEIAASTGFADQSHLSRWVRRVHGVSPTQLAA